MIYYASDIIPCTDREYLFTIIKRKLKVNSRITFASDRYFKTKHNNKTIDNLSFKMVVLWLSINY